MYRQQTRRHLSADGERCRQNLPTYYILFAERVHLHRGGHCLTVGSGRGRRQLTTGSFNIVYLGSSRVFFLFSFFCFVARLDSSWSRGG
ncbi:hypothetical protein T4D_13005 [Trichinella pseudospiralis]|uniref:Transmembrane protein n=1 Tax=Trichinella pseudospiralis TaxID=6337 RepID=A0A0V1G1C1_TRIPS|nr:hypothetical protein T4D_13005 [Trichinella pseudospiralis]